MTKRLSRRDFMQLAVLTTGAGVLAACSPAATTAPAAPAAEPTKAPAAPAAEAKEVRMGVWASPEEVLFFNDWVKPWQDKGHPVKIEYVDWTTYWTKLPTQFSAGTAPDVMEMSNYTMQFGPQGVLADQNNFFSADTSMKKEDFVPVPFEKFTYQGKLVSFPMCLTIQMLAYNKDIFDAAKEPYPDNTWDWAKMVEVAKKFTKDKNGKGPADADFDWGNVTQWGIEMDLGEESGWSALVFQNGAEYWLENYTKPNFTDPLVVDAFQFLSDMINTHKVAPSPAAQLKFNGSAFQAGQAAMARQGTYMMVPYFTNIKSFKWDVTVPPKGKTRGVMADGIGWSMSNSSTVKDDAWKLIKYFNTEGQTFMGGRKWAVPILKTAFDSFAKAPPDHAGDLKEEFDYGHRWPSYTNNQQVDDYLGQKITEIFNAKTTPIKGLQEIQDFVAPLVKG